MGHLPASKLLFECRMDKFEIRRRNLRALLDSHCGGKAATLANLIDRSPSYVARMLYPEGKEGKKRIGEDMRDIIENALALKRGTLDVEPSGSAEDAVESTTNQPAPEPRAKKPSKAAGPSDIRGETTLERLDASEKKFLDLYRRATEEGKIMIERTAIAVPKTDD
jgi:hypothetical protein